MGTSETAKQIRDQVDTYRSIVAKGLTSRQEWGEINFLPIENDLNDRVVPLIEGFSKCRFDLIPEAQLADIHNKLSALVSALSEIDNFSVVQGEPGSRSGALMAQIRTCAENFYTVTHDHIAYWGQRTGAVDENLQEIRSAATEIAGLREKAANQAEQQTIELGKIIEAAKQAGAEIGVGAFTTEFSEEAKGIQKRANIWLWATFFLAVATASFAYLSFIGSLTPVAPDGNSDLTTYYWIHSVTSKFVLLGVLITSTLWCGRVYKALSHQVAINKHRAAALKTFQAFVNAAETPEIKDAVLIETTRAIFGLAQTGYLGESDQQGPSGLKIVEVARSLSPINKD